MKDKFSINIRFVLAVIAIGCIGLSGAAFAENPSKSKSDKGAKLSSADKGFIKDAAKGGMMEVAMGRIAEENATDAK
jgi:hypothetical protein